MILEVQLSLHILAHPELAASIDSEILSARPRELVDCVDLGPRLCREVGPVDFVTACMSPASALDSKLLVYVRWLDSTPDDVRDSLPPFEEVLSALERLCGGTAA